VRREGVAAEPVIETRDARQRDYWSYRLSISQDDLSEAISKVGPSVAAIRRHLRK
jgi:predicted RNA-binding protein YlqC (UPF0109 family)